MEQIGYALIVGVGILLFTNYKFGDSAPHNRALHKQEDLEFDSWVGKHQVKLL